MNLVPGSETGTLRRHVDSAQALSSCKRGALLLLALCGLTIMCCLQAAAWAEDAEAASPAVHTRVVEALVYEGPDERVTTEVFADDTDALLTETVEKVDERCGYFSGEGCYHLTTYCLQPSLAGGTDYGIPPGYYARHTLNLDTDMAGHAISSMKYIVGAPAGDVDYKVRLRINSTTFYESDDDSIWSGSLGYVETTFTDLAFPSTSPGDELRWEFVNLSSSDGNLDVPYQWTPDDWYNELCIEAPVAPEICPIEDDTEWEGNYYSGPTPSLFQGTPPVTWSLVTGPAGMTISSSTGRVSWSNPTLSGSPHTITIRATNSVGSDDESWQLTVNAAVPPVIDPILDDTATDGIPYTGPTPTLSEGSPPVTWSLAGGPLDMTIDSSTGVVSWANPTVSGSPYTITIEAANPSGSDTEDWVLTVLPAPPVIDPIEDEYAGEGTPYTGPTPPPTLSQGTLPVTWSLIAGPSGMTIDSSTGVVSWADPTVSGSPHTVIIQAENAVGSDTEDWQVIVGTFAPVPFSDTFPNPSFDPFKWSIISATTIDTVGIAEPSSPYSARLNGMPSGGDELCSVILDLSGPSSAELSYSYQRCGGGDSPETGDDLIVEYKDGSGTWVELERQLGSGSDMSTFVQSVIILPPPAFHSEFQFRFRNIGSASSSSPYDDWFVDNVALDTAPWIVTHPTNQTVSEGTSASFTVSARGTEPLAYQWEKDGSPLSDAGNISGSQTHTLTMDAVALSDAGSYACDVMNDYGSGTSDAATLTVNTPVLSVNVVGSGTVSQDPEPPYHLNDVVTLTANPSPGWSFAGWSGGMSGTDNPDTIIMDGHKNVTATFTQDEYALTVNVVGSGTVDQDPLPPYHLNDVVTLTAVPSPGWFFAGWSGDMAGSANPDTTTIDGPRSVTATFTQDEYALTVNVVGSGTVDQDPLPPYHLNDVVTLTAVPSPGWFFAGWSGDMAGSANPDTITMDGPRSVTATFTQVDFTASPTSGTRPLTVEFTDLSTGTIDSWFWEFGDGYTSTEQNPSHTYYFAGDFNVTLTASGPGGSDSETRTDFIHVDQALPASGDTYKAIVNGVKVTYSKPTCFVCYNEYNETLLIGVWGHESGVLNVIAKEEAPIHWNDSCDIVIDAPDTDINKVIAKGIQDLLDLYICGQVGYVKKFILKDGYVGNTLHYGEAFGLGSDALDPPKKVLIKRGATTAPLLGVEYPELGSLPVCDGDALEMFELPTGLKRKPFEVVLFDAETEDRDEDDSYDEDIKLAELEFDEVEATVETKAAYVVEIGDIKVRYSKPGCVVNETDSGLTIQIADEDGDLLVKCGEDAYLYWGDHCDICIDAPTESISTMILKGRPEMQLYVSGNVGYVNNFKLKYGCVGDTENCGIYSGLGLGNTSLMPPNKILIKWGWTTAPLLGVSY